ncbi:MAG: hypothetical protein J1E83_12175 [Lachnospiraceae bacterium]|nr:hypothetical protein [Lachnospiraceae bacterium]
MGYASAEDILPKEVLALVQQYVDGQLLYIPRKEGYHRAWGSMTDTKKVLVCRNEQIYHDYQSGITVSELAKNYCLTEKSIQRIIRTYKK